MRRRAQPLPVGPDDNRSVCTGDGLRLHVEVDQPDVADPAGAALVLVHGYALNLDCWRCQRLGLRTRFRVVAYDQRGHGRSERCAAERCTIDRLGADLATVLDQVVPAGPVVLAGHSMGGMAIMALAEQCRELFGQRVRGVALVSTTAGGLADVAPGLPGVPGLARTRAWSGRAAHRVIPAVLATLARVSRVVESGRRASGPLATALTRHYSFGGGANRELVALTEQMLASTPLRVVADFFPGFALHDRYDSLAPLARVPVAVVSGTRDRVVPAQHSRRLAEAIPSARLYELTGAGHMVILERSDEVNAILAGLLEQARQVA